MKPPTKRMPSTFRRFWSRAYAIMAYCCGLWQVGFFLRSIFKKQPLLAVFTFHRISSEGSDSQHLVTYDKGTEQSVFEQQIQGIKRFYEVLTLEEFIDIVTGKCELTGRSALVTFDDADSEFISQAMPVLTRFKCPSVVFVPTKFVDSDKRFWHLRVSNAFQKIDAKSWPKVEGIVADFCEDQRDWMQGIDPTKRADIELACWRFNIALDRMDDAEIESYVERLEAITGKEYSLGIAAMGLNELKAISKHGVYVESHTCSHRKLARLDSAEVRHELADSKQELESKLGKSVRAICYPAGSYNKEVAQIAREVGYEVGFITTFGFVDLPVNDLDLLALPRFDMRGSTKFEIARFLGELPLRRFRKGWPLK